MLRHFFHQKRLQRESHINPLYNEFISIPLLCSSFYSFDIPPMQVTYGWNGIYRNYAEIWQMLFHLCLLQASPDAKPDPKIAQAAEATASLDEWFSWGLRHRSGWRGRVDRSSASWKKMKNGEILMSEVSPRFSDGWRYVFVIFLKESGNVVVRFRELSVCYVCSILIILLRWFLYCLFLVLLNPLWSWMAWIQNVDVLTSKPHRLCPLRSRARQPSQQILQQRLRGMAVGWIPRVWEPCRDYGGHFIHRFLSMLLALVDPVDGFPGY